MFPFNKRKTTFINCTLVNLPTLCLSLFSISVSVTRILEAIQHRLILGDHDEKGVCTWWFGMFFKAHFQSGGLEIWSTVKFKEKLCRMRSYGCSWGSGIGCGGEWSKLSWNRKYGLVFKKLRKSIWCWDMEENWLEKVGFSWMHLFECWIRLKGECLWLN